MLRCILGRGFGDSRVAGLANFSPRVSEFTCRFSGFDWNLCSHPVSSYKEHSSPSKGALFFRKKMPFTVMVIYKKATVYSSFVEPKLEV